MSSSALTVKRGLRFTGMQGVSIAATSAISLTGLEVRHDGNCSNQ